jgi:phosphoribosylformylglycinamidine synthase
VTGQTEFDSSYNGNILVNAMAVGLFRPGEEIFLSKACGPGNWVVYVGAKTGKDGVHGASMASESFDEDSESKRPNVQIGDPFFEKLLIESCLEVMSKDLVEAIQDMGAAGLTSSSFEMAARGEVGLVINLDKVPLRDRSLTPEEILLSESQERMLLICKPEKFDELQAVFYKWGLDATLIGSVTENKTVRLLWKDDLLTEIDPSLLVDQAPEYDRPYDRWVETQRVPNGFAINLGFDEPLQELKSYLMDPRGCSREWIYSQYDQRVGGQTVRDCSDSVAVVRLPDSGRALGLVLGARPQILRFDALQGGYDSIAYPALELSAKGFEPLAATDCLNFGNPEKKKVMNQFVAATRAMSEMCECMEVPIISGNVSFYNETLGENITPTPSTGLVGLRDSVENIPRSYFQQDGDEIYLLRLPQLQVGGMAEEIQSQSTCGWGELSAPAVAEFGKLIRELSLLSGVQSTRVVGKFGLAYALARMSLEGDVGCSIDVNALKFDTMGEHRLFSEVCYEILFAVRPEDADNFTRSFHIWVASNSILREVLSDGGGYARVECRQLGMSGGDRLQIGLSIDASIDELKAAYYRDWGNNLESLA